MATITQDSIQQNVTDTEALELLVCQFLDLWQQQLEEEIFSPPRLALWLSMLENYFRHHPPSSLPPLCTPTSPPITY